ncbi:MAG: orotidine-5'-phosphate decarboxylase [Lentisphaeria bacterium]|nr:orotidine-5'-phosphate decarboxylase [Lentisphaeria bacterium]
MTKSEVIVALDYDTPQQVQNLLDQLSGTIRYFKVGKQLFTQNGPSIVKMLKDQNYKIFLDLKFHDIPNTTAQAVRSALELGVDMVNVHASGGSEMMRRSAEAAKETNPDALLIAVTVLTSMDQNALSELGLSVSPQEQVIRLAKLAQSSGIDGVVASAKESSLIREACGVDFNQVLPGIRPRGADVQDQKRVLSPGEAAAQGAQYLVIGRPITKAESPAASAEAILKEIAEA